MSQNRFFDEAELFKQLSQMPAVSKVAFALCCATRQSGAYEQFAVRFAPESQRSFKAVVDRLWNTVVGDFPAETDWEAVLENVMALMPEEQDHWAPVSGLC